MCACDTCRVAGYSVMTRRPCRIHVHVPFFLSSATAVLHPAGWKKTVLQPDTEGTREQTEKVSEPNAAQNAENLQMRANFIRAEEWSKTQRNSFSNCSEWSTIAGRQRPTPRGPEAERETVVTEQQQREDWGAGYPSSNTSLNTALKACRQTRSLIFIIFF